MSKNNKLTVYLIAGYIVAVVLVSLLSIGSGFDVGMVGLIAITISAALAALLFLIGMVLFIAGAVGDRPRTEDTLDRSPNEIRLEEDRITPLAFFSSAGLILLIGGSLCLGTLSLS